MSKREKFLSVLEENLNLQKLNGADYITVKNAFFANYVTALLLIKLQDLHGLKLINDPGHAALTKFSPKMSDLNFWGRAMFYSSEADVMHRLKPDEVKSLIKAAGRISTSRIQQIMKVPLTPPERLDWAEVIGATLLLSKIFDLKSSYFSGIMRALYKWETLNVGGKQKAINDLLMFMLQSDPGSSLIPHLRRLSSLVMRDPKQLKHVAQKIISFIKLREDEGGGAISTGSVGTTNNAIIDPSGSYNSQTGQPDTTQNVQNALGGLYRLEKLSPNQVTRKSHFTIRAGKLIKKRVKSFSSNRFKAPEFLKFKKTEERGEKDAA